LCAQDELFSLKLTPFNRILSSNFEALMVACVTPLEVFLARELHKAIAGLGTDEATLVEILCSFPTNNLINDIKTSYQERMTLNESNLWFIYVDQYRVSKDARR